MTPNRIRELRQARHLTLEEVALRAGISIYHLSRMERGLRALTDTWMHRIAAALGVPPAALFPHRGKIEQEVVESQEELGVLRWWRRMSRDQKMALVTLAQGLGTPPTIGGDQADKRRA
jgi:transcriptional regulator with XRE-family HTH domain